MQYVAALDGLRALAVIMVMAFHAHVPGINGGYLGVDIFFVLSGFLVTSILLSELDRGNSINLKSFYQRRLLRLTPALFTMLLLYLAAAQFAWPLYPAHLRDALLAAAYVTDYSRAIWQIPDVLRHTWSLSVEMHFYLLWPLVLARIAPASRKTLFTTLLILFLLSSGWRMYTANSEAWHMVYYRFDTRLSGLLLGAVIAAYIRAEPTMLNGRWIAVAIAAVIALIASAQWQAQEALQFGVTIAELAAALLILAVMQKSAYVRWMSWPPLVYIGRISYGLYLFHYPIMFYLRKSHDWWITLSLGFVCALALATFSYHLIECKIKQWRLSDRVLSPG